MDNTKKDMELLMARMEQLREAQVDFNKNGGDIRRKKVSGLETQMDDLLRHYRRKGYNPDEFKKKVEQNNMF